MRAITVDLSAEIRRLDCVLKEKKELDTFHPVGRIAGKALSWCLVKKAVVKMNVSGAESDLHGRELKEGEAFKVATLDYQSQKPERELCHLPRQGTWGRRKFTGEEN